MKKRKFGPRSRGELIPLAMPDVVETTTRVRVNQADLVNSVITSGYPASITLTNGTIMKDIVTEDFQKKKAAGIIVNNPMSKSTQWAEVTRFYSGPHYKEIYTGTDRSTGRTLSVSSELAFSHVVEPSLFPTVDLIDMDYVRAEAVNAAYANAHQRNVMGLVDIAESGKTFNMLRTNLGRLESLMTKGVVHTLTKKAKKYKGNANVMEYKAKTNLGYVADAANLHLEVQYGIIPLMLSINGLVKTLTDPVNPTSRQKWPQTFRGSESAQYEDRKEQDVPYFNTAYPSGSNKLSRIFTTVVSQNTYARAGVMTRYKPGIKQMLGLELRDLVPGAYELIPMSFVADWVFNLGTYLEAVTPVKNFSSEASWVSLYNEVMLQYIYGIPTTTMTNPSTKYQITYFGRETEFVRGYRTIDRIPGVVPLPPHFNSELKSLTHFISGAALALSKVTHSKPFRKALTK